MDSNHKIVPSFKETIFNSDIKNTVSNWAEFGIDAILEDGLFKDIPIVNTLTALAKFGANIHDRNMIKQTLIFIETFANQTIEQEKLDEYRDKINNNPKKAEAELSRVIIILNTNIDEIKSKLLAKFYTAYVNSIFDWDVFCELSDMISRFFISDIDILLSVYRQKVDTITKKNSYHIERLNGLGLISKIIARRIIDGGSFDNSIPNNSKDEWSIKVTPIGNYLCQYGLYPLYFEN